MDCKDRLIADAERQIVQYQFREAVRRLQEEFERRLSTEPLRACRGLVEKTHLISGNRRLKHMEVACDRRKK